MKVLDYCSSIPSKGIHHYAALVSQGFNKYGLDVKIVTSPGEADPGVRNRLKKDGIDVIDFPWSEKRGFLNSFKSAGFLSKIIRDFEPDVIHTWGFIYSIRFWLALKQAKLAKKIPIVTTISSIRHGMVEEWPARIIGAQLSNFITGKVCVQCSSEKQKMLKSGVAEDKLRIVFHPVDFSVFEKSSDRRMKQLAIELGANERTIVTSLAQFSKRKGHKYLLQAMEIVIKKHPEILLVLAGDGPLLESMEKKVLEMGLVDNIVFPGRITIEDVQALLQVSKLGIVSSLSETFGLAIVEPLLLGVPVVTTDVGVAQDIAQIGGVKMVKPKNVEEMTDAILSYIENPKLAKNEAEKGRNFVLDKCNFNNVVKDYVRVFEECIN